MEESSQQSEFHNTITSQEEVPTSLENFRIVSESPEAFHILEGYDRSVLQLNSAGEFFVVNPSDIPTGSHSNPLVDDPFWTADIVRSPPRMVRDLYGTGIGADAPITYTVPLNHFIGATIFSTTPSVGPNTSSVGPRSTFSLQTTHSTMAPHVPTIPASNAVVSQAEIGTPIKPRPSSSLHFGYRALNSSAVTTTQVMLGSYTPIQQPGGTGLGGFNPLRSTGQSSTSGSQILGTPPQAGGHPPTGGQLPFGGHPHAGGKPQSGAYHQPYGQNVSTTPNLWNIPFPGNPQFSRDTILKLHNNLFPLKRPIYILLMDKRQIRLIILKTHPVILRSHMFLKTPQILCTLVNTNLIQEDPLVTIIHLTQCMVLLVFLCHTSITRRLTNNYLS
jgi:hypothetical protein